MLLQPNHFFRPFCGQRVPLGYVATFVLGYKSHCVAEPNVPALTVMLCSRSFHPSSPNTISTHLRRLAYRRVLRTDSWGTEVCKGTTVLVRYHFWRREVAKLKGCKRQLTTENESYSYFANESINCHLLVPKMASAFFAYPNTFRQLFPGINIIYCSKNLLDIILNNITLWLISSPSHLVWTQQLVYRYF